MSAGPSTMSAGLKNWHWRTKGVEHWAKEWFTSNLTNTEAKGVYIDSVTDVEGDAELGLRKSRLRTIYDLKVTMSWKVKDSDVSGSLVAVEVAHDMDEDEYVFTSSCDDTTKDAEAFHKIAKKDLADKLRPKFQQFPKDMLATHGKDLLAQEDDSAAASPSGTSTPVKDGAPKSSGNITATPSVSGTPSSSEKPTGKAPFNTSVVRASGEYATTADELFVWLTDEQKIPMWSRNPAKMTAEVGSEFALFGGNINGKVTQVTRPKSITMTWRAPTWPDNYYGSLAMTLEQGSNSTTLSLRLSGVPVGKEDEAEQNITGYYIQSLKQIGSVFQPIAHPVTRPRSLGSSQKPRGKGQVEERVASQWPAISLGLSVVVLSLGLATAYWFAALGK